MGKDIELDDIELDTEKELELSDIIAIAKRNLKTARIQALHYIENHKDDMDAYYCYGKIEEELGNLDDAKVALSIVAASENDYKYDAFVNLGMIAKRQKNLKAAKKYLQYAIDHSQREEKGPRMVLSAIYRKEKNYTKALSLLAGIKNITNDVRKEMATILSAQKKYRAALAELNKISPKSKREKRELAVEKAILEIELKNFTSAEYYLLEAKDTKKIDRIYYRAMYQEAILAREKKEYIWAKDICEDLLANSYDAGKSVYIILGEAEEALKNYPSALENYQISAKASFDPKVRANGYFHMGMLQYALGDFREAEKSFNLIQTNVDAINRMKKIKLIGIYFRQGRYEQAEELVRSCDSSLISLTRLRIISMLISKANNQPLPKPNNYSERQIVEYSREAALKHIKDHHQVQNTPVGNFSENIDINTLFDEIKLQMVDENMVYEDIFDIYDIDYQNAGYDLENQFSHQIRVVAIPNTKDIITMFPCSQNSIRQKDKNISPDSKQSSQMTKFNSTPKK